MNAMEGKITLVTGANSGLGKATALGLAKLGATVVMVCRSPERGEAARKEIIAATGNPSIDLLLADLSSQQSIHQLAQDFQAKYQHLDVLINSIGGVSYTRLVSVDGIEYSLALNHLASFLLTNLLLDVLKTSAPSRIVNVTTRLRANTAINFDDLQFEKRRYSGFQSYSETKLANILFTYALARKLQGTGVTVNCVHPGVFKSNFGSERMPVLFRILGKLYRPFMTAPAQAAERVLYLATSPEVEGMSGKYFAGKKELTSPKQSYDKAAIQRLWDVSAQLVKLKQ